VAQWYDHIYKDNETALKYSDQFIQKCEQAADSIDYYWLSNAMSFKMFLLQQGNNDGDAVIIAQKIADRLEGETQPMPKAFGFRQLCVFYERLRDSDRATKFCRKGYQYNEEAGTEFFNNSFYETLAIVMDRKGGQSDSVLYYRKKGLHSAKREGSEEYMRVGYSNLAYNYSEQGNRDSADKYFKVSADYFQR